jgi:hypothetical protein
MKIRVQQRDGSMETISVVGPLTVHEGDSLSRFQSAEGMDHFFTADGFYDGWGRGCSATPEEASELIQRIEAERESAAPAPSSPHDHKHTCSVVDNFSPLEGYCTCDPEHPLPWPTMVDESEGRLTDEEVAEAVHGETSSVYWLNESGGIIALTDRLNKLLEDKRPERRAATEETPLMGPSLSVDEIAQAIADARLWLGAWAQMCDAERNVMRQGAEGVHKLLAARREPGSDALNEVEVATLLHLKFGVSSVTGAEDVAWLTDQLNKLLAVKRAEPGPGDGAMGGALRELTPAEVLEVYNGLVWTDQLESGMNKGWAEFARRLNEIMRHRPALAAIERSQTPQRANSRGGQHET